MTHLNFIGFFILIITPVLASADPAQPGSINVPDNSKSNNRYGVFETMDSRSSYGQGVFPEPFLVDDSDLEQNEARLDWLHTSGTDGNRDISHSDVVRGELEKGFGQVTLELAVPLERDRSEGVVSHGFGNIELGARCPFYQLVSDKGNFDTTFGTALEVGIPTSQSISRNAEIVPKLFNDTRWGNHLTLQSLLGYSTLLGHGGDEGGVQNLEYGFVLGYTIRHEDIAIPGLQQLVPVFELNGERQMNRMDHGHNSLLADIGIRANLNAIGPIQPRLGAAFVFPVDNGASQDVHYGVATSLVFEY